HPVTRVSWEDANAFCQWIGGRLPTEAEREYAARGGLEGKLYPWGDDINHDRANYEGVRKGSRDEFEEGGPVMSFDRNPFGLSEMAGNVGEWCGDWFDPKYYQESEKIELIDPKGPESGRQHVARGGSAFGAPRDFRVSHRTPAETGNKI